MTEPTNEFFQLRYRLRRYYNQPGPYIFPVLIDSIMAVMAQPQHTAPPWGLTPADLLMIRELHAETHVNPDVYCQLTILSALLDPDFPIHTCDIPPLYAAVHLSSEAALRALLLARPNLEDRPFRVDHLTALQHCLCRHKDALAHILMDHAPYDGRLLEPRHFLGTAAELRDASETWDRLRKTRLSASDWLTVLREREETGGQRKRRHDL